VAVGLIGVLVLPVSAEEVFGGFDLSSGITLRGGFENLDGTTSHTITAVPEFTLSRSGNDLSTTVSGNLTLNQQGKTTFALRGGSLSGALSKQFGRNGVAELGLSYGYSIPRADNPDLATDIKTPGHTQAFGVSTGYTHSFSKTELSLRGSLARSQTSNSILNDDTVQSNADQNSWRYEFGGRVSRQLTPIIAAYFDAQAARERYDTASASLSASRDNYSVQAEAGAQVSISNQLSGELGFGVLRQTFDDTSLATLQTWTYNGALQWDAYDNLAFRVDADTEVSPSNVSGEAMRIVDNGRVSLSYRANDMLSLSAYGSISRQHYQGNADDIKTTGVGFGADYLINNQLSTFANYNFSLRQPSAAAASRTHMIEAGFRFTRQ